MDSHIAAVMGRIQEIEARLGITHPARTANLSAVVPPNGPAAAQGEIAPFSVALAQANGCVHLEGGTRRPGPFSPQIETLIQKYAAQNGLDAELVRAVVQQESSGNPREQSGAGAQGLMQLMPATAEMYGVRDSFDPEQNIAAGTRHLSNLMREFKGDVSSALAAYNAGSAAVHKYSGIPPYAETQDYVRRITQMCSGLNVIR